MKKNLKFFQNFDQNFQKSKIKNIKNHKRDYLVGVLNLIDVKIVVFFHFKAKFASSWIYIILFRSFYIFIFKILKIRVTNTLKFRKNTGKSVFFFRILDPPIVAPIGAPIGFLKIVGAPIFSEHALGAPIFSEHVFSTRKSGIYWFYDEGKMIVHFTSTLRSFFGELITYALKDSECAWYRLSDEIMDG